MNEYSRVPILLRNSGMLNEYFGYSDVTGERIPTIDVDLCMSDSCSPHWNSGVVVKSYNGQCRQCGHVVFSKSFYKANLEQFEERCRKARLKYDAVKKFDAQNVAEKEEIRKRIRELKAIIKILESTKEEFFFSGSESYSIRKCKYQIDKCESEIKKINERKFDRSKFL